jgi:hypothetical protein
MTPTVPVITGNFAPFRLIMRDTDQWEPSFQEVVNLQYDFGRLHRISTGVDVGILPLSMLVCFDGTFAIPFFGNPDPDNALEIFNRTLSEMLIGGLYCEAMSPDDLFIGEASHKAYVRHNGYSSGLHSRRCIAFRTRYANSLEILDLWKPDRITVSKFHEAIFLGRDRLKGIEADISSTLLYGCTFYARGQWSEALLHLWTTAEQIIAQIWKDDFVNNSQVNGISSAKRKRFLGDNRTWSASTIIEVLYQTGKIDSETYSLLDKARVARNSFVHRATRVDRDDARSSLEASMRLASLRLRGTKAEFQPADIVAMVDRKTRAGMAWGLKKPDPSGETEGACLPIPPVPSFPEWGNQPYEIVEELCFIPIEENQRLIDEQRTGK